MKKLLLTLFAAAMMLGVQNANASVKLTALSGSVGGDRNNNGGNANEGPAALVDEQTNSKFGTWDGLYGQPVYIIMKSSAAIAPTSYELITANDTNGDTGRSWSQWKIYGGNFASDAEAVSATSGWTLIDNKTSQSLDKSQYAVNKLNISETIASGTYYTYFKIVVEANEGGFANKYCQMDGFRFTNVKFKPQDVTFTYSAGSGNGNRENEGMDKLFDLDCNTKYCGNTGSDCYALVTASEPVFVWGYDLTTANDNNGGRKVTKWSLYGTNDATIAANANADGWVALSNMAGNSYIEGKNWYTQRFFCNKNTIGNAYKYFKVTLDEGGFVQLSAFRFCYDTHRAIAYNWTSGPSDAARNAFDGLPNTKWQGSADIFTGSSNAITIETSDGNSYAVKKYHFTTNDDGSWKDRAPKSWKIEGSNDNSDWTTIAEVDDKYAIHNANYTTYEFTPDNTTDAFRYVRLTINSMKSTGWSQIGDFQVLAVSDVSDRDYYTGRVSDAKAAAPDYETLMGATDPWYVEYKGHIDELDDILSSCISSGNYDPIATALVNVSYFVELMTPFAEGSSYSAVDGTPCFSDSPYSQLFDGKDGLEGRPETKWGGNFTGSEGDEEHVQYVIYRVKTAFAPYFYKLVTGGDTKTYTGRNWKSWNVYGGNFSTVAAAKDTTSSSWILLDERTDISEAYLPMENNYPAAFNFTEGVDEDYYYYMVKVFAAHSGSQIQMSEMYLCTQSEFETVLRAPLVAYFNDFDKTRPIEASKDAKMTEFNTLYAQLLDEDDPVELTLVYNQLVALRTELEESMDYLEFYAAKTVDGVFQLGTADELKTFAAAVNKGRPALNAVLTADINYSSNRGVDAMIGDNGDTRYAGTFNGQGHTVTVNFNNTSETRIALFRQIEGGTIQNLKVAGTITTKQKFAGGIASRIYGSGTISNCESAVTISDEGTGDATHGGILGYIDYTSDGVLIQNCLFSGTISASNREGCGGIVGWGDTNNKNEVKNCLVIGEINVKTEEITAAHDIIVRGGTIKSTNNYYVGTYSGINLTTATSATATQMTSGELCYILNGNTNDGTTWTQTIGTDANPVLFPASQTVHQASPSGYTNLTVVDSKTQIATGTDLKKFASEVNAGNTGVDAVLTDDINMNEIAWPKPIGDWHTNNVSSAYAGHFDGQGHTVSNLTYTTTQDYHGLFGVISNATVENFTVSGSVTNASYSEFGAIGFARDTNPTIRNVHSYLNFENTNKGARIGGILGRPLDGCTVDIERCTYSGTLRSNDNEGNGNYGGMVGFVTTSGNTYTNITNCLFDGTLTNTADSPGNCTFGGIVGYIGDGPHVTITNCLSVGTVASTKAGKICGAIKSGNSSVNNCYYNNDGTAANSIVENSPTVTATSKEAAQLASGEVCYLLNGSVNAETNWYQTLGTDANPSPFGSDAVDRGQWLSDDYIYYNVDGEDNITVPELNLSDTNTKYEIPENVTAQSVTMTRSFTTGKWFTFCSPFAVAKSNFSAVKELTSITTDGTHYTMTFDDIEDDNLVAGKPYMVQVSKNKSELTATKAPVATAVTLVTVKDASNNSLTFTGVFAKGLAPEGSFIISSNAFYLVNSDVNLGAFRGYITTSSGSLVKALNYVFEDTEDGIQEVENGKLKVESSIYNVAGQRISKMQRGINIVNGKKILK